MARKEFLSVLCGSEFEAMNGRKTSLRDQDRFTLGSLGLRTATVASAYAYAWYSQIVHFRNSLLQSEKKAHALVGLNFYRCAAA